MKKINIIFCLLSIAVFNQTVAMDDKRIVENFKGYSFIKTKGENQVDYNTIEYEAFTIQAFLTSRPTNFTYQIYNIPLVIKKIINICKPKHSAATINYKNTKKHPTTTIITRLATSLLDQYQGLNEKLLNTVIKTSKTTKIEAIIPNWQKTPFTKMGFKQNLDVEILQSTPYPPLYYYEEDYLDEPNATLIVMNYKKDD